MKFHTLVIFAASFLASVGPLAFDRDFALAAGLDVAPAASPASPPVAQPRSLASDAALCRGPRCRPSARLETPERHLGSGGHRPLQGDAAVQPRASRPTRGPTTQDGPGCRATGVNPSTGKRTGRRLAFSWRLLSPVPRFSGTADPWANFNRFMSKAAKEVSDLGTVYALTGEERYAKHARDILVGYSNCSRYGAPPNMTKRSVSGLTGMLFTEALQVQLLSRGYDLSPALHPYPPKTGSASTTNCCDLWPRRCCIRPCRNATLN